MKEQRNSRKCHSRRLGEADNAGTQKLMLKKMNVLFLIGCAKGIFGKGIGEVRGFPFCGGKKGLRLPIAVEKGV